MTPAHKTLSLSDVWTLTPDELWDYRAICRQFIRQQGPVGWAYERETRLLLAINRQLTQVGHLSAAW